MGVMGTMHQRAGHFPGYTIRETWDSPCHYEWYLATEDSVSKSWCIIQALSRELCHTVELRLYYQDACRAEAHVRVDGVLPIQEIGQSRTHGVYVVYPYRFPYLRVGEVAAEVARAHRKMTPCFCASVLLDAVRILDEASRQGLCHFGVLPHHILISRDGDVYVTGFIESAMRRRFHFDTELNEKFDAPEIRRHESVGVESDVYALGALLYQGITNAFQPDEWEPRWMGMMDVFDRAGIPGDSLSGMLQFFQRTLAERPSQRYGTYGALAQALEHVISELGSYVPCEVRADFLSGMFDDYPPAVPCEYRSDVISLITGDFPTISGELSSGEYSTLNRESIERMSSRLGESSGRTPGSSPGRATSGCMGMEDTLTSPSFDAPETRILHRSSGSFRTINPSLRADLCASPLEILARSRYQILDQLGSGGTGTVYKVLDTTLSEILALKVLRPELVADSAWLQRFKRELKITRDLEHANILQAYHLEQLEGLYFFTMRYIDGRNLSELLHEGPLSLMMSLRILPQVAQALIAAHAHGVVHRDLKPANIMIENDSFHPYLMDFGIASAPDSQMLTIAGQGIGTPSYMAPEQSRGEPITILADVYSFGVMCYECFTQTLPFTGATAVAIYTAQQSGIFQPILSLNPRVPAGVARTIEACLSPRAFDRPANMGAVLESFMRA